MVPDLGNGLRPLAHVDAFWYCEGDTQIRSTVKPDWEGICSAVMLTGPLTVIGEPLLAENKAIVNQSGNIKTLVQTIEEGNKKATRQRRDTKRKHVLG